MTKGELEELIHNGENSGVEFKLDEVENHELAKEIVAFANLAGGVVLLGVSDDGTVRGTVRENLEEWVMELCRTKIDPPLIPYFEWYRDFEPGKDLAVVRILTGPAKPYARVHHNRRNYFIRVGSTSQEARQDELERMFQASGRLRYGMKPVPGAEFIDFDLRRLKDYFGRVLSQTYPDEANVGTWEHLLINLELMVRIDQTITPTIDGLLLFGRNPKRFLPQSGIRALAFAGTGADYAAQADQDLSGPMLSLYAQDGSLVENGLVEQALDFINRNTAPTASLQGGVRVDRPTYPSEVLREVIVNALVHRDYSIAGTDITLTIFADRLEMKSPGRLPNMATVEALKAGFRYARNQTLVNVMRDYRYVDFRGMGIREKIIPGMLRHNGTEPDLIATEYDFTVRLWKEKQP
ncbi:MAG: ATP-binding protein [Candidatus Binatia bacterium]